MGIREATEKNFDKIWPFFHEIAAAGQTYAYPTDISKPQAKKVWMDHSEKTYVFEDNGEILGSYYIKTNHEGPGNHVCNCGYMVAPSARNQGVATAMCIHSQNMARSLGYKAMQFNFVASTNEAAVKLWKKHGFVVVGRLPKAFYHPFRGYVDALVMYKWLEE